MPRRPPPFRVTSDDPAYLALAAAEAAFWSRVHVGSIEAGELRDWAPSQSERYHNARFTGDERLPWPAVLRRFGTFRRGLVLGTSSLRDEARLLEAEPRLHAEFVDLSPGAVARREAALATRFPGRVATRVADLNFIELEPERYDLIVSVATLHHVTNLEWLADQINAALTPGGTFIVYDYVGENRFQFSATKRRIFEALFARDVATSAGRAACIRWRDATDLSPFCGVRAEETLDVLRAYLAERSVRVAGTLIVPLLRAEVVETGARPAPSRASRLRHRARARFPRLFGAPPREIPLAPRFFAELAFVGELLAEAGAILPGNVLAVYGKR